MFSDCRKAQSNRDSVGQKHNIGATTAPFHFLHGQQKPQRLFGPQSQKKILVYNWKKGLSAPTNSAPTSNACKRMSLSLYSAKIGDRSLQTSVDKNEANLDFCSLGYPAILMVIGNQKCCGRDCGNTDFMFGNWFEIYNRRWDYNIDLSSMTRRLFGLRWRCRTRSPIVGESDIKSKQRC
ncbi:hypothetical protein L596_000513 [Steinernema carpocapsae]|uniref:Uncharacterized protein n=1 Tax=Steinernema carpocapsae TaxID=34508 RepID=A0A4U8UJ15_STECR|nr:hypothetical protein L596_000513 [Steinernema carpocapsae]